MRITFTDHEQHPSRDAGWYFTDDLYDDSGTRYPLRISIEGIALVDFAQDEFVEHYHLERNHQGLDNRLITAIAAPVNDNADPASPIARRERLGGLLSYYYRVAA